MVAKWAMLISALSSTLQEGRAAHARTRTRLSTCPSIYVSASASTSAPCAPALRPKAKVEPIEDDADEQSHDHTRLLGGSADEQNPASQNQLATHLEWLPPGERHPELVRTIVRQECGCTAQRGWNTRAESIAARP
eukprot:7387716-Prymnesium_polylepis.1